MEENTMKLHKDNEIVRVFAEVFHIDKEILRLDGNNSH
jgi:hypothetical protein